MGRATPKGQGEQRPSTVPGRRAIAHIKRKAPLPEPQSPRRSKGLTKQFLVTAPSAAPGRSYHRAHPGMAGALSKQARASVLDQERPGQKKEKPKWGAVIM